MWKEGGLNDTLASTRGLQRRKITVVTNIFSSSSQCIQMGPSSLVA